MSMDLVTTTKKHLEFSKEQAKVLRETIAATASDAEFKMFIWQCERTGLDPFSKQIYFIKGTNGKVQIQTSIDGFRVIAERSGLYEGQTPAQWCGADGAWKELWTSNAFPVAARIGVYKKGFREPLYAIAHWMEYFAQPGHMHKKMPALMLAKVAESLALRKAFPNDMEGLYTQEEMGKEAPKEDDKNTGAIEVKDFKTVYPDQPSEEDHAEARHAFGYTFPFGTIKMMTPEEALRKKGPEELARIITLIEERAATGKPYANNTFETMNEAIKEIEKILAAYERGEINDET